MFSGLNLRESGNERGNKNSGFHTKYLEKVLPCSLAFGIIVTEYSTEPLKRRGGSDPLHISRPVFMLFGPGTMRPLHQQLGRHREVASLRNMLLFRGLLELLEKKEKTESNTVLKMQST